MKSLTNAIMIKRREGQIVALLPREILEVGGACNCMCYTVLSKKGYSGQIENFIASTNIASEIPIYLHGKMISSGDKNGVFAIKLQPKGSMTDQQCHITCAYSQQYYYSCNADESLYKISRDNELKLL